MQHDLNAQCSCHKHSKIWYLPKKTLPPVKIYKTATDRARQEGGCAVGSDGETERRKEDLSDR
jgi:hypothetical protein